MDNKIANTKDNESLNQLFCMMESQGVLSESFKQRIIGIGFWILCNHEKYESEIKEANTKLKDDMKWLNIFSNSFIDEIYYLLERGLSFEINKK